MSSKPSEILSYRSPFVGTAAPPAPFSEGNPMSRRRALPIIGLLVVGGSALGACDVFEDPLKVTPTEEAERLRSLLAAAQEHRGGIQRFALHHLVDNVEVRVEDASTHGQPDRLVVTVYEVDPETRQFVMQGNKPKVLEVHRNMTNATLSQIESDRILFYYLYEN